MRFGLFGKDKREAGGADAAARVKRQVRELLGLPENAVIAVNEILCADPACPGTETVILVMKPGEKTRAFKAQMGLAELTPEALAEALSATG
ncbi:conserved hypothetical protein [Bosea sp. 62]|uniref:hypothetical protein n=1 Tax=unclassified Bosea (in: a-proteobacteria) TaxID=2653178 RepID=UPI001255488C|nr:MULTISPECIES: hypothetical protein [unclassified Bosea (in: a-proteobacteria)]CAD5250460.1 conserved hypothetical protein [Bosea sp. 7B]CAD5281596.1 conserved hypothetical protein [Bosea sp. 21B]CAD5283264.1 conserved hypothetical protein [Bosea sp. 46]VVT52419.1 conserved hypothetical protein [Bosea sp. EC-HK365B]VXB23830.1 conserved hypothetical protein [Bosea sp. 62]